MTGERIPARLNGYIKIVKKRKSILTAIYNPDIMIWRAKSLVFLCVKAERKETATNRQYHRR